MAIRLWLGTCVSAVIIVAGLAGNASAQMFADSVPSQNESTTQDSQPKFNNSWANPRKRPVSQNNEEQAQMPDLDVDKTGAQARKDAATAAQKARQNAAEELSKSLAGKRGTRAPIRRIYKPGEKRTEEESLIFLFYKDFDIRQTMSGMIMCDVRFSVLHTLDNKINNLSFRLKWPEIETTLSYNDVEPNTETYFDYTLVGDGCYSMDKIPNVIVNRCRVKGLSQSACANKIRWLKKQ